MDNNFLKMIADIEQLAATHGYAIWQTPDGVGFFGIVDAHNNRTSGMTCIFIPMSEVEKFSPSHCIQPKEIIQFSDEAFRRNHG